MKKIKCTVVKNKFARSFVGLLSWDMLKVVLGRHDLIRSNSRDRTVDRVASAICSDKKEAMDLFRSLWVIYEDVICFGDKAVRFYKLSPEKILGVVEFIESLNIERSVFSDEFPLPKDGEILASYYKNNGLSPAPVRKYQLADGEWLLLFASSRFFTEQEHFDEKWVQDSNIKILSKYTEIVAKRRIYREAFDFILVRPAENIIEVGIDHPDTSGIFSQTLNHKNDAFKKLIEYFNEEVHHLDDRNPILTGAIRLFDTIKPFFERKDGRIFRAKFLTADGLDDHPNMLNYKTDDYREARFFKGGRAEVDQLTPYRVSVVWTRSVNDIVTYPLLNLQGTKKMLRKPSSHLREALISNTMGFDDYRFTVNKLFSKISAG